MKQIIFIFTLLTQSCYSQSWDVSITGTVSDMNKTLLSDIKVNLIQDALIIDSTLTDTLGYFTINSSFSSKFSYFVSMDYGMEHDVHNRIKLYSKGDSVVLVDYVVDVVKLNVIQDRFDTNIYYDYKQVETPDLDMKFFVAMIKEYPQMCVEVFQSVHPDEKSRIYRKRMELFKEKLVDAGVNMNQLVFSEVAYTLFIERETDKRSRIHGVVLSMEGDCK